MLTLMLSTHCWKVESRELILLFRAKLCCISHFWGGILFGSLMGRVFSIVLFVILICLVTVHNIFDADDFGPVVVMLLLELSTCDLYWPGKNTHTALP